MIAGVVLGLTLAIMAGAHIATTLSTAKELDSLRQAAKSLRGEIEVLKSDNRVLYKQLSTVITQKERQKGNVLRVGTRQPRPVPRGSGSAG